MLRLTAAVISGSTALHVLDIDRAHTWIPNDLDIYTPAHTYQHVVEYLVDHEHYKVLKTDRAKPYSHTNPAINRVVHLERDDLDIDVIQSCNASALYPIPHFWSSHLMNYLSADGFCIAYPDYTLTGRGILTPNQMIGFQLPTFRTLSTITKYVERGYEIRTQP
ncbi:uncharacterized protein TRAVEDRAFT_98979, partial [Trametes versicolor FP-101664 SS1]|uniref:uncharacterized protein n=1 Tax=Trametes versicolor (strain FP-101664) TaxID=717944 RepID=UPI000462413D